MILSTESKYPSRRAHVIKLRSDATTRALVGRLRTRSAGEIAGRAYTKVLSGDPCGSLEDAAHNRGIPRRNVRTTGTRLGCAS
jgi:hypothetical protein